MVSGTHILLSRGRFTQVIRNSLSCRVNFGMCVPIRCPVVMREIGTCFGAGVKCCRRW
ncbi:hypothetical protein FD755_014782 [Muntiacus reevesi]|uniref:Beta/alpha-defensin C-terminal domain-containing protein n=1 Tax=Muntiacus reevesi TaxID=9886 RepID=A0A5N3XHC4_MUNRE|nr:hypothetical protein FD755_014782 [Muntiacus reevesi]